MLIISLSLFCSGLLKSQSLSPEISEFLAKPELKGASVALLVQNIESGQSLQKYQSDLLLLPASSIKSLSTLTALRLFGADHSFKTRLILDGELGMNGVWIGDLVVESDGDPSFLSPRFNQNPLALIADWKLLLEQMGIAGIKGQVLVLDEYFKGYPVADGVVNEDVGNYYGGGAFGFNCFDNTYSLEFNTLKGGENAEFVAYKGIDPILTFTTDVGINARGKDLAYVMALPYSSEIFVKGSLPARAGSISIEGAYPDPARAFANYLYSNLSKQGIIIIAKVNSERNSRLRNPRLIAEQSSPSLEEIIFETNRHSINMYADALFRHCGIKLGGEGEFSDSGKRIVDYWKELEVPANGVVLQDGSGLSRSSAVSADFIAKSLAKASDSERDILIKAFKEISGKGNTIYYKSGYMSGVMALSGYIKSSEGEWSSFSFLVNGHQDGASALRKEMVNLLLRL